MLGLVIKWEIKHKDRFKTDYANIVLEQDI